MSVTTFFLLSVGAAGCIGSETTDCGDQVCPKGWLCKEVGGARRCIQAWQLTYCGDNGLGEGTPCDQGGFRGYQCAGGLCVKGQCGDGITDLTEECDQGSNNSDDTPDACRTSCRRPRCGDGVVDHSNFELCDQGSGNASDVPNACRANCTLPRCGDGIVDATDVCDDGNLESGDGCSGDCQSDETCGNGYVDAVRGEICDDHGLRNHDGCTSDCRPESLRWTQITSGEPAPRVHSALAYDAGRGRIVLFGGDDAGPRNDTWEHDGVAWRQRFPARSPPRRYGASVAYDSARRRVVLFGGLDAVGGALGETWEYEGETWAPVSTTSAPSPRAFAGMAYDEGRHRIVLFGGLGDATSFDDTWQYDGVSWSPIPAATSPPARRRAGFAYDPHRGEFVLFGGLDAAGNGLSDTWLFDGASWRQFTRAGPGARWDATLAFCPQCSCLVLFGGSASGSVTLDEMWKLRQNGWVRVTPGAVPAARAGHAAVNASPLGGVYVAGGAGPLTSGKYETWAFRSAWRAVTGDAPAVRISTAAAFDPRRGSTVMFGGANWGVSIRYDDTWELRDETWLEHRVAGPSARLGHAMAYHTGRGAVVLFGGDDAAAYSSETWEFADGAWRPIAGAGPGARAYHGMTYDATRDKIVLFGGIDSGGVLGDTWEYGDAGWSEVTAISTAPAARQRAAMAYHPLIGVTILFGGMTTLGGSHFDDTWSFDGSDWWLLSPARAPIRRASSQLAWDGQGGQLVLMGGEYLGARRPDSWAFDGVDWHRWTVPGDSPPTDLVSLLVADPLHRRMIFFGGPDAPAQTWHLRVEGHGVAERCSLGIDADGDGMFGCDDPDCQEWCALDGDGVCDPVETCRTSPLDCGACTAICGDFVCDPGEQAQDCPGDCS